MVTVVKDRMKVEHDGSRTDERASYREKQTDVRRVKDVREMAGQRLAM